MRKIRGWIRNLADGLGPNPGSVNVEALLNNDPDEELNLESHTLGYLDRTHETGGSGDAGLADATGHFGWDMEFSPGPITVHVNPTDPQDEFRLRFPDESAQIGKAYHSDLERLGWAAGRDCLVYGAIEGAVPPTAATWIEGPESTSLLGDWGVVSFGSGGDAGRLTLRRGIGFLGGVVFSVEGGDLLVPVAGETAAEPNSGATDRWDLLYASMDIDPTSATYGKQRIRIQSGGSVIPSLNQVVGERRMVIHALKMVAGASVYSAAYDLRPWVSPPAGVVPESIAVVYESVAAQQITGVYASSILNTQMASSELILNPAFAWDGVVQYTAVKTPTADGAPVVSVLTEGRMAVGDDAIEGTNFVVSPASGAWRGNLITTQNLSFMIPLRRIPAYSANGGPTASTRSWSRLRFRAQVAVTSGIHFLSYQTLSVKLWPVP